MSIIGQPLTGLSSGGIPGIPWTYPIVIPIEFALQIAGEFQEGFVVTNNFCQAANAGIQLIVQFLDEDLNALNISGATSILLAFQLPDGTQVSKTAQFLTNGIDGQIYYISTATDFVEAGLTYIQAQVTVAGSMLTTAWAQFAVNGNL